MIKHMNISRLLSIALMVLLTLVTALSAAPRLVIPETTFNFGLVPQNSKIAHVFWLYSKGDDSLVILKVTPGCGCTQAPLEKSALAVGDSTRLEVIFNTKHYTGQISKRPRIDTNEGPPEKSVQIDCEVMLRPDSTYPVIIKPYKLDISQFGEKVRDQMKFSISNVSDKPFELSVVSAPTELLVATVPKRIEAGQSVEASVKLQPDALTKEFEKSITIQLSDEKSTRFTIPVKRALRLPGDTTQAASSPAPSPGH
jgi:hypothetical protein